MGCSCLYDGMMTAGGRAEAKRQITAEVAVVISERGRVRERLQHKRSSPSTATDVSEERIRRCERCKDEKEGRVDTASLLGHINQRARGRRGEEKKATGGDNLLAECVPVGSI